MHVHLATKPVLKDLLRFSYLTLRLELNVKVLYALRFLNASVSNDESVTRNLVFFCYSVNLVNT
jgi:hypothetical protein